MDLRADLRAAAVQMCSTEDVAANLETASARSRDAQNDVTTVQSKLTQTQLELSKAQANAVAANDMQKKLADLQSQNEKLTADVKSLQQQLIAAKEQASKMAPPPPPPPTSTPASTMPTMNK